MKRITTTLVLVTFLATLFSCSSSKREVEELVDPWLRERTPQAFRLESQVGAPVIVNNWRDDQVGNITVTLVTSQLEMDKVKISELLFEEGTVGSVTTGDYLDFSSGTATMEVTSASGDKRIYTIDYLEFYEELEGVFAMSPRKVMDDYGVDPVVLEGGVEGNAIWLNMHDKGWQWKGGGDAIDKLNDYMIEFVLESVNEESGATSGTVTITPGDGGFFEFIWSNSGEDFSNMYQLIPNGSSKWEKNGNWINFYDESGKLLQGCEYLDAGASFTSDHETPAEFVVEDGENAFHRAIEKEGWWNGDDFYGDKSRYIDNCRRVMWIVKKVNDEI